MIRRVRAEARRAAMAGEGITRVERALELTFELRYDRLANDHHPEFLHPARTTLILLRDAEIRDDVMLAAAATCETLRPDLRLPDDTVRAELGEAVLSVLSAVPTPRGAGERLLELLVSAPEPSQLVAVAERLDHARHLHFDPDRDWASEHATSCHIYARVAERLHPLLARRYLSWCQAFARRRLRTAE